MVRCLGLMAALVASPAGGILYLYGPFKQGSEHTSPKCMAFDELYVPDRLAGCT